MLHHNILTKKRVANQAFFAAKMLMPGKKGATTCYKPYYIHFFLSMKGGQWINGSRLGALQQNIPQLDRRETKMYI